MSKSTIKTLKQPNPSCLLQKVLWRTLLPSENLLGTTKKNENKNFKLIFSFTPESGQEGLNNLL